MKPNQKIEEQLTEMNVTPGKAKDAKILSAALQAQTEARKQNKVGLSATIWGTIIKTPIIKVATAILLVSGLTVLFINQPTPAYGLSQALEVYGKANIVHIKGQVFFVKETDYGQEHCGLPTETWVDRRQGQYRELSPAGHFGDSVHERPRPYLTISDGRYQLETSWLVSADSNEVTRTAHYRELTPFQQQLEIRRLQTILDYSQIDGFVKIGSERTHDDALDIWQGELFAPGESAPYQKLMVWLSATTGEIQRLYRWSNTQLDVGKVNWRLLGVYDFQYDVAPPKDCFVTETPADCQLENTKATALKTELGMSDGRETFYAYLGLGLEDGSIILGWHAHKRGELDQSHLFENVQSGGPLPQLPAQIRGLTSYYEAGNPVYVGRHLTYTQKDGRFYEWGLYVPKHAMVVGSQMQRMKVETKFNDSSRNDFNTYPKWISVDIVIRSEEDFNKWVLGAMAELSDVNETPTGFTYARTLKLCQDIRQAIK